MNTFIYMIGLLAVVISSDAYVYLQVRKGDNQSNVDALIHKVLPNRPPAESRKRLELPKRYELLAGSAPGKKSLESVVLAINTGAENNKVDDFIKPSVMQKIQEIVVDFFKDDRVNAFFRSKKDTYNVKPEIVQFQSGNPSLMLELDFKTIMRVAKDVLRSKKLKQYTDTVAQKAAVVFKSLKQIEKEKRKADEYL